MAPSWPTWMLSKWRLICGQGTRGDEKAVCYERTGEDQELALMTSFSLRV